MTATLLFPAIMPSRQSAQFMRSHITEIRFGDGRVQRAPRGGIRREWRLLFADRPRADIDRIDAFLTRCGGVTPFIWRPPHVARGVFICHAWDVTPVNDALATLRAQFLPA